MIHIKIHTKFIFLSFIYLFCGTSRTICLEACDIAESDAAVGVSELPSSVNNKALLLTSMSQLHLAMLSSTNNQPFMCCVLSLVAAGANPDTKNSFGQTLLSVALKSGNFQFVKLLWHAGASFDGIETDLVSAQLSEELDVQKKLFLLYQLLLFGIPVSRDFQEELNDLPLRYNYRHLIAQQKSDMTPELHTLAQKHGVVLPQKVVTLISEFIATNFESAYGYARA